MKMMNAWDDRYISYPDVNIIHLNMYCTVPPETRGITMWQLKLFFLKK